MSARTVVARLGQRERPSIKEDAARRSRSRRFMKGCDWFKKSGSLTSTKPGPMRFDSGRRNDSSPPPWRLQ
jgi:hypothetical protein